MSYKSSLTPYERLQIDIEKWIQAKFEELSGDIENCGRSAEDLYEEAHEAFDDMLDEMGDIKMEETREAKDDE